MNPTLKQAWIDALLDDDSNQMIGGLRKVIDGKVYNDAWGLLLDIVVDHGPVRLWYEDQYENRRTYYFGNGPWMEWLPSYELLEALGIPYNAGPSADIRNYIAGLNDNGSNFIYIAGEVAQYIE